MQRETCDIGACLKAHCEQNQSSPIAATDIAYDAFTYASWHHRLTWMLPFECPNASILKGDPSLMPSMENSLIAGEGTKFKLVKTMFNINYV